MHLTIPVEPDADEARRWATEELAKSEYQTEPSTWLDSISRWIQDFINGFGDFGVGFSPGGTIAVIVVIAALIGLVVWLVMGPMRRSRAAAASAPVWEDDARSAEEMEAAARGAADRGDWDLAVTEIFRATVRKLDDRGVVDVADGMTADEAARAIGAAVPHEALAVNQVATDFDVARYCSGGLTSRAWERALSTYATLGSARRAAAVSEASA